MHSKITRIKRVKVKFVSFILASLQNAAFKAFAFHPAECVMCSQSYDNQHVRLWTNGIFLNITIIKYIYFLG